MKTMVIWEEETADTSRNASGYGSVTIRGSKALLNTKDMENWIDI
jgi:hypothetical protein